MIGQEVSKCIGLDAGVACTGVVCSEEKQDTREGKSDSPRVAYLVPYLRRRVVLDHMYIDAVLDAGVGCIFGTKV